MLWQIILVFLILSFGAIALYGAPYVPSRKKYIHQALEELYHLGEKDLLVDIGSGDGVVLREASRFGARAVGYELNPILFVISHILSIKDKRVTVHFADYWTSKIPNDTTVIYVFSVTRDIKKLSKWTQKEVDRLMKPIYIISFGIKFKGIKELKNVGAYHLYVFLPLQSSKAQV